MSVTIFDPGFGATPCFNVANTAERNAIPRFLRVNGMICTTIDPTPATWQLNREPWDLTDNDWTSFGGGGGGSGTVTSIIAGAGLSGGTITTTGTIAISNVTPALGGTGLATLTAHAVLVGAGTSNVAFAAVGTSGRPLIDQGASADPAFLATGVKIDSHFGVITADTQSTSTWTVNLATSDWHAITLTQSIATLTISNGTVGQQFTLVIIQGGSGSYTVAWPSNTLWPGGVAPTLTTTVGGIDVITVKIVSAGHYYAFVAGQALA